MDFRILAIACLYAACILLIAVPTAYADDLYQINEVVVTDTPSQKALVDIRGLNEAVSREKIERSHVRDLKQSLIAAPESMLKRIHGGPDIWTASIGASGDMKCYDINTIAEIDCTAGASDWDVQIEVLADGPSWTMWVKGVANSGAFFGTLTKNKDYDFLTNTTPDDIFFADEPSSVFNDSTWYEHSLKGDRNLWPNYIVDTATKKYKLQITSYFDKSATSALISL